MTLRPASILLCLVCLSAAALADELTLTDGTVIQGLAIGQTSEVLVVMKDPSGETVELPAGEVVAHRPGPVSKTVAKQAEAARLSFFQRRRREVKQLVRDIARAEGEERVQLQTALRAYLPAERVEPLGDVLAGHKAQLRPIALEELERVGDREALNAILRSAMDHHDAETRASAHAAAWRLDRDWALKVYGAVAAHNTKPERRLAAIDHLQAVGGRPAAEQLLVALAHVLTQVRLAHAVEHPSRQPAPVTLNNGNTSIPVELPALTLYKIETNATIPAAMLDRVANYATAALQHVTGEKIGQDPDAWKAWLDQDRPE